MRRDHHVHDVGFAGLAAERLGGIGSADTRKRDQSKRGGGQNFLRHPHAISSVGGAADPPCRNQCRKKFQCMKYLPCQKRSFSPPVKSVFFGACGHQGSSRLAAFLARTSDRRYPARGRPRPGSCRECVVVVSSLLKPIGDWSDNPHEPASARQPDTTTGDHRDSPW